jgi:hypothetical protein
MSSVDGLDGPRRNTLFRAARSDWLGWMLLVLGLLVFLGRVLLVDGVLGDSDILLYYYPVKSAILGLWDHGRSLAWNPFLGEGQPLAGNPEHELAYPLTWPMFFIPLYRALALSQAVHFVVAWFGVRRLVARLGCSRAAGLLAAVTWSFGALWISAMHFFPIFFGLAWVPWLAAGAARRSRGLGDIVSASLAGGLLLLVGEPVTILSGALGYAVIFATSPMTRGRLGRAAVTAVFCVGLGAATLVPAVSLARRSVRAAGIELSSAEELSFPPLRLVELLAARATGNPVPHTDRDYWGWRLYPEHRWPFFTGLYCGAFFLPLFLLGAVRAHRGRVLFVGVAIAFVFALGSHGGVWSALRGALPLWRGVRYPEKFLAVSMLLATSAMAIGFDIVRRSRSAARFVLLWTGSFAAAFTVCALFSWPFGPLSEVARWAVRPSGHRPSSRHGHPAVLGQASRAIRR